MTFAIGTEGLKPLLFLLLCLLPVLGSGMAAWVLAKGWPGRQAFAGTAVLCLLVLGAGWWQLQHMQARMGGGQLQVRAGVYRTQLPLAQLRLEQAQLLPRDQLGPWLQWRSNGIGMPGLQAGWFRGRHGRVFAALGKGQTAVVIPTAAGYSVVLSPDAAAPFLAALRAEPASPPAR